METTALHDQVDKTGPVCSVCGRALEGRADKRYCSGACRIRAFRMCQQRMGRRRTRFGYQDGLSATTARDTYGEAS